jgi:hypothetical protein
MNSRIRERKNHRPLALPGFLNSGKPKYQFANDARNHFPATIRLEYIISNGSGLTLISPRNGLSNAPSK